LGCHFRKEAAEVTIRRPFCFYEEGQKMRHEQKTTLKITRIVGTTSSGKDSYSYLNLPHVNPEIADDDLLEIGTMLAKLQALPVASIGRTDACLLAQEHD
jgi:hypothetical protein